MPSDLLSLAGGSNDALHGLRAEARRLKALAEGPGLSDVDFDRLARVFKLMAEAEASSADKLLSAVGLRLRFRNAPDDVLHQLLASVAGPDEETK